jgi:hypothetical protein
MVAWQADPALNGRHVNRIIYDSGRPITFALPELARVAQGAAVTVEWDFDGNGVVGQHPAEQGNHQQRQITYSPNADGQANVQLPENAANRRKTYTIRARVRVQRQGGAVQELVLTRTLRVALAKKQVSNNPLPKYFHAGPDFNLQQSDDFLHARYNFAGLPNIAWRNFAAMKHPQFRPFVQEQIRGAAREGIMEQRRIILGSDFQQGQLAVATTFVDGLTVQAGKFPDIAPLGTVVYRGTPPLQFDLEELDHIVAHERNQVKGLDGFKNATSVDAQVYAAYVGSNDPETRKLAAEVKHVWTSLERELEDLARIAAGGQDGDASWAYYQNRIEIFSTVYQRAAHINPGAVGSLAQIKAKFGDALYKVAYDRLVQIHQAIPAEWDDLRTMQNQNPLFAYRFMHPSEVRHPKPQ